MASCQSQQQASITLKGSAEMVRDYLHYAMHNVLYQRGFEDSTRFDKADFHGLSLFESQNSVTKIYIDGQLDVIQKLLETKFVDSVHLIVYDADTDVPVEKWTFKVNYETNGPSNRVEVGTKDVKKIKNEMSAVLRQIFGTMTILPEVDSSVQFKIQIRCTLAPGASIPNGWAILPTVTIENEEKIGFKPFSTSLHHVASEVHFKKDSSN